MSKYSASYGSYEKLIQEWVDKSQKSQLLKRLWLKEPELWTKTASAHKEIKNRLGWLTIARTMKTRLGELNAYRDEVKAAGYTQAVLLGMGGSSLGSEVLQTVLGNAEGFPQLYIIDSTDPGRVKDIESKLDMAKTLFIVSSKSGGTIELVSLFKYFFDQVKKVNPAHPGTQFVAITDPNTALAQTAKDHKFGKVFLAPEDVGGRFSALTVFGLVPACVIGADIAKLLETADRLMGKCVIEISSSENAALELGVAMAVLAESGRDKLTLITSEKFACFGDWVEQLVAESTGKEDMGIVPVAHEPLLEADTYGPDRFFVVLQDETLTKEALQKVSELEKAGHPVFSIRLKDGYDLGGEFFRWEMATAIACALLKVNAFDQPDVQAAKESGKRFLERVKMGLKVELKTTALTPDTFWENAEAGDYVAILAFLPDREPIRKRLEAFRDDIRKRTRLAATLGFGPRYLHSTGQLHKGGPNNGLYILITAPAAEDLAVPGEAYSFGQLELAQAMGDFEALENKARWLYHVRLSELSDSSLDEACQKLEASLSAVAL